MFCSRNWTFGDFCTSWRPCSEGTVSCNAAKSRIHLYSFCIPNIWCVQVLDFNTHESKRWTGHSKRRFWKKNLDIKNISNMTISEIDLSLSSLRLLGGPTSTIDQHPASVFRYFGVFNATQTPQKREGILISTEPAFDRQRNPRVWMGISCLWGLAPSRHPIPSKAPTTRP